MRLILVCHFELRRKEISGLDFKEKVGNSEVDKKEQTYGQQFLLFYLDTEKSLRNRLF